MKRNVGGMTDYEETMLCGYPKPCWLLRAENLASRISGYLTVLFSGTHIRNTYI